MIKWVLAILLLLLLLCGLICNRCNQLKGSPTPKTLTDDFCVVSLDCSVRSKINDKVICPPTTTCPAPARCYLFESEIGKETFVLSGNGTDSVDFDKTKEYRCICAIPKNKAIQENWFQGNATDDYCRYKVINRYEGGGWGWSLNIGDEICVACPANHSSSYKCDQSVFFYFRHDFYFATLISNGKCEVCPGSNWRISNK